MRSYRKLIKTVLLLFVGTLALSGKCQQEQWEKHLEGVWLHSKEEDKEGEMVFRREDYDFPPTRFRQMVVVEPNGVVSMNEPGSSDIPVSHKGSWEWQDGKTIVLKFESGALPKQYYHIESVKADKLVVSTRSEDSGE